MNKHLIINSINYIIFCFCFLGEDINRDPHVPITRKGVLLSFKTLKPMEIKDKDMVNKQKPYNLLKPNLIYLLVRSMSFCNII